MVVQTHPGAMALQRIPCGNHSLLRAFVNCPTAPLLAVYAAIFIPPWNVARLAVLMIVPWILFSIQCLPMSRQSTKTELRLTLITSSQVSCGYSAAGHLRCMPATFTRISILWSFVTVATIFSTDDLSPSSKA